LRPVRTSMANHPILADTLTRFLTQSGHFSRENKRVKERAFLPDSRDELSVFEIIGLDENEIWSLFTSLPLYGRADFLYSIVLNNGLRVEPDNMPPRHANIVGWPLEKSEKKSLAQSLAAEAALILHEETP
jgi:hypothetical protein